jgi:rubrerythrin
MNQEREWKEMRFCPHFRGSVGQDERTGRRLMPCYSAAASLGILYGYRRLMAEPTNGELCALFEEIERDKRWHFLMLGRLIFVLGVCPAPSVRLHLPTEPLECTREAQEKSLARILNECIRQESVSIERFQNVMGSTADRVVRSFLAQLIGDEERHIKGLQRFFS